MPVDSYCCVECISRRGCLRTGHRDDLCSSGALRARYTCVTTSTGDNYCQLFFQVKRHFSTGSQVRKLAPGTLSRESTGSQFQVGAGGSCSPTEYRQRAEAALLTRGDRQDK
jgi:hypothetical protein